jgi:hypothetical protein
MSMIRTSRTIGGEEKESFSRPQGTKPLEPEVIMTDESENTNRESKSKPKVKKFSTDKNKLKAEILNAKIMLASGKSRYDDGRKVEAVLTELKSKLRELEE